MKNNVERHWDAMTMYHTLGSLNYFHNSSAPSVKSGYQKTPFWLSPCVSSYELFSLCARGKKNFHSFSPHFSLSCPIRVGGGLCGERKGPKECMHVCLHENRSAAVGRRGRREGAKE